MKRPPQAVLDGILYACSAVLAGELEDEDQRENVEAASRWASELCFFCPACGETHQGPHVTCKRCVAASKLEREEQLVIESARLRKEREEFTYGLCLPDFVLSDSERGLPHNSRVIASHVGENRVLYEVRESRPGRAWGTTATLDGCYVSSPIRTGSRRLGERWAKSVRAGHVWIASFSDSHSAHRLRSGGGS